MITTIKRNAAILIGIGIQTAAMASVADSFTIPQPDNGASAICGATVPYTRYDCNSDGEATLSSGATIRKSPDWARSNIASQASKQAYVDLPAGASVEWTMSTYADGVTARFTLADNSSGTGISGAFDVYVDGQFDQTVDITSYFMWQYFDIGNPRDTPTGTGCFAFDETHFRLHTMLRPGSKIKLVGKGSTGFGIDFIETEVVPEPYDPYVSDSGRAVFNVADYGASPGNSDNVAAFNRAVAAATAVGGVVYIPEGTWKLAGMWSITSHDVKITGAGIWYTNLKFTSDQKFGGGISGGNKSNTGSSAMNNMEICHFYMNSNLRSRYGEQAVYKGFMDVYRNGSVIHDVWEEHFECGMWFGDYNDPATNPTSDGVKVVSCRLRNNLADGVNFCQGTSNATVYNCSVRNNGDDGLACWNNNYQNKKDESGNVFAYNTIDFIWRAGGIAIYGGDGFKIYNNYICDMFMAAGIHLNTTFDGYKFSNTRNIIFENNVLVRCGTNSDSWNEDLAAIDLKQSVRNVTFKNTRIYDSPFHAVRFMNGPENIVFDGLLISGAGLARANDEYSCVRHSCCAGRLQSSSVSITNMKVAEASITPDLIGNNSTWPFWTDNNSSMVPAYTKIEPEDAPPYPDAVNIVPKPKPWDELTDYDLELSGLCWQTQRATVGMKEGDKVSFRVRIDNLSTTDIPAEAKVAVKVSVDGSTSFTATFADGLPAGEHRIVSFNGTWMATPGAHTFKAELDPNGQMKHESDKTNNIRSKEINVDKGDEPAPELPKVSGGYDVMVTKITYGQDAINVGDQLYFTATVANIGDRDVPAGKKIGVQFQVDGKNWATGLITWCDSYSGGLAAGKTVELKANGGGGQSYPAGPAYWTALSGEHTVMAWVNDDNSLGEEIDKSNNQTEIVLQIPYGGTRYNDNPDKADDLDRKGKFIDYETDTPTAIVMPSARRSGMATVYTVGGVMVGRAQTADGKVAISHLPRGLYVVDGKKFVRQ